MTRDWFKCDVCGIECDNSVKAPMSAPGEPSRFSEICRPCAASFCPCCDSLYTQPTPTARQSWTAQCPECGHRGFFNPEIARNIVELNHRLRKEPHQ